MLSCVQQKRQRARAHHERTALLGQDDQAGQHDVEDDHARVAEHVATRADAFREQHHEVDEHGGVQRVLHHGRRPHGYGREQRAEHERDQAENLGYAQTLQVAAR